MSGTVSATETELLRLKDRLAWLEQLIEERQTSCERSLDIAKETLNERLDKMNDIRSQLNSQANEFSTKVEHDALSREVVRRFESWQQTIDQYRISRDAKSEADLAPLRVAIDKNSQTNWPMLTGTVSVLFVLITGGWSVMGLKIESAIAPLSISMEQLKLSSISHTDRLRSIETDQTQATMRADIARNGASLIEIETQFCGQDDVRNQIHATDLRWFSMLWKKVFNQDIPISNAYYPKSAKCGGR